MHFVIEAAARVRAVMGGGGTATTVLLRTDSVAIPASHVFHTNVYPSRTLVPIIQLSTSAHVPERLTLRWASTRSPNYSWQRSSRVVPYAPVS